TARSWGALGGGRFRGVERSREAFHLAIVPRPLPEMRTLDACRTMSSDDAAGVIVADHLIDEEISDDRRLALDAEDLRNMCDATGTVTQTLRMDDHIDRLTDHLSNCF